MTCGAVAVERMPSGAPRDRERPPGVVCPGEPPSRMVRESSGGRSGSRDAVLLFCAFPSREAADLFVALYERYRAEGRTVPMKPRAGWTPERRAKVAATWAAKKAGGAAWLDGERRHGDGEC